MANGTHGAHRLRSLFDQPRGLYLVSITEFWERFSYWGMLGLLVLFLTAAPAEGGFGWSTAQALSLYALYTGAIFSAPAVGGFLASRYFGERRSILWGGVAVACGHLLLTGPVVAPWLVTAATGIPVDRLIWQCGYALGQILPGAAVADALSSGRCASQALPAQALSLAYFGQAWTFTLGLILIVVGTGFIKSTVSSIVGKLYEEGDRRREEGFAIFMAFIYVGALCSNLVAGTLGEKLGWHYGFAAAGLGMAAGLVWYVLRQRAVLGDIGMAPDRAARPALQPGDRRKERERILLAILMSLFVIIYALAFYQKGGMLNLETKAHVDRTIRGFEVPATWLLSVSTLTFILLSLSASRLWKRLAAQQRDPDPLGKLLGGLAALAIAYALLLAGLSEKQADGSFSLWWLVAMYVLFGVGDLLVWPVQIASVSRLAPARHAAFAVGSWYLTIGIGSWLTGTVGSLGARSGIAVAVTVLVALLLFSVLLLFFLRPRLLGLAHGAFDSSATKASI